MSKEERIATFRRDCIESMVGNTCDNIHDTGNSLTGVSIRESAAYYLVRASYCEGDLEDVATELSETADLLRDDFLYLEGDKVSKADIEAASRWDEEDIKTEVVDTLRQMTGHPLARDLLLRCIDVIEGLFGEACPWPEMSELLDEICQYLKEGEKE
jgi:predicted transcriptional regulator